MSSVVAGLAPVVLLAALVLGAATLISTGRPRVALPVFLDLLVMAGLLRLSATASWQAIGSVAVLVLIRKLAASGINRAGNARAGARR